MGDIAELNGRRDNVLGAGTPLFYSEPLHLVRGEGVSLFDPNGRRYTDMYNNVASVGHCHPHVVEAISRQVSTLNVHSRYLHEGVVTYAERLTQKHHDGIECAILTCSGTEANEVALLMARGATKARGIICTDAAYHGNSAAVGCLTRLNPREIKDSAEVRAVSFPDTYRFAGENPCDYYLEELDRTIESFKRDHIPFAGMLVCSIFANEGLPNVPHNYMPQAIKMVHDAGGLFICDEVQSGLCRTGNWWGYENMGIHPDIATMGKPIGAGVPLAAVAASRELVEGFRSQTRYFNTFASSPLQAAAGNAVLDVIENEGIRDSVKSVGSRLLGQLEQIQERCEQIGDVRGVGLFIGMEWVTDRTSKEPDPDGAKKIVNALKEKGFLISNAGAYANMLKIRPPLVFERSDGDSFIEAFQETLHQIYG